MKIKKSEEKFGTFWYDGTGRYISLSKQDPRYEGKWMVMHNMGQQPKPFMTKKAALDYIREKKAEWRLLG